MSHKTAGHGELQRRVCAAGWTWQPCPGGLGSVWTQLWNHFRILAMKIIMLFGLYVYSLRVVTSPYLNSGSTIQLGCDQSGAWRHGSCFTSMAPSAVAGRPSACRCLDLWAP